MRRHIVCLMLGGAAIVCGAQACNRDGTGHLRKAPREPVGRLAIEGRSSAHVTLAAEGRRVAAVWIASGDAGADVFAAVSEDAGERFGVPVRVNDVAGDAGGNGEQPPRVVLKGSALTVVWVSKRDGVSGIRAAQSNDGGRTFAKTRTISPDGVTGARGWESAAIDDAGIVHAAWLDGRHAAPMAPGAKHAHGAMRQDIVHAMWRDGEAVVESPVAADVCFCCKTGVAVQGNDVFVVWRHLFPGGVRDIAIARSADGGRTFSAPVRVSADNWKIDACPDDGPAIAIDRDGAIHVVWPTLVDEDGVSRMVVFEAVSRDRGATFSPRVPVGDGETGASHPRVAVSPGGRRVIVWDSLRNGARRVSAFEAGIAVSYGEGTSASYPAIASAGQSFVLAWTEKGAGPSVIRVTRTP